MKITEARVIVTCPGRNFVTLKIVTDEGIYGLGDATLNGRELSVVSYLQDHVAPCLIGRDPQQIEDIWQYLYRGAYWRRGPVTMTAIAAVDTALWDLKGKIANLPLTSCWGRSRTGFWCTDMPMVLIFPLRLMKWAVIARWVTRPSGHNPVYQDWTAHTGSRRIECFMNQLTMTYPRKISGLRPNI